MRRVLLAFALLLVHTSVSKASPIADDQTGLPFRYPVWWRPSEDARSYWDPVIARLIWTHPALRRYYKELAGWESSNGDRDRPSLLKIMNEYEEHEPLMLATCREDNRGENVVDEEQPIDRREEQQEEPASEPDAVSNSADMEMAAESEHRENNGDEENQSNENSVDSRESENTTDRKRRSVASENQLLCRILFSRADLRSRLDKQGICSGMQPSGITAGEFADMVGINIEDLISLDIVTSPDEELLVDLDLLRALVDADIQVDLKELQELLGGLLGDGLQDEGGLGTVLGGDLRRLPSGSHDRLNGPFVHRHTAAFGERTAKRDAAIGVDGVVEPVPATRTLKKLNLNDVDVNQLLDDLRIGTVRVHVRSADPDYTTEESTDDDDEDSGDSSLVNAEVLTGDTPLLESKKKRTANLITVARSEAGGD